MTVAQWDLENYGMGGLIVTHSDGVEIPFPGVGIFDPTFYLDTFGNQRDAACNGTPCLVSAGGQDTVPIGARAHSLEVPTTLMRGRVSAQFKTCAHTIGLGPFHAGVYCLGSQMDLSPGGGAQAFMLHLNNVFSDPRIDLVQMNNGLSSPPGSALATTYTLLGRTIAPTFNVFRLQFLRLDWEVDLLRHKGVHLTAYWREENAPLTLLFDIVYTGAAAYKPTSNESTGVFVAAITNFNVVFVDNVQVAVPN